MTPNVERLGLLAAGALAGALSTFIVMRLVFTPAPLPPPPPPTVQVVEAVEPAPLVEPVVEPVVEPAPVATQTPAETPPRPRPPTPPPAVAPPAPTGTLSVITTSSGATQPPIFVDRVEKRAGRTREQLPSGTYQVKVVCPADSANPGWAPVKSVSVEVGEDVGLRVDCDNKSVENF